MFSRDIYFTTKYDEHKPYAAFASCHLNVMSS